MERFLSVSDIRLLKSFEYIRIFIPEKLPLMIKHLFLNSFICFFLVLAFPLRSAGQEEVLSAAEAVSRSSFNAGEMILDHVVDKHSWHIMTCGNSSVELHLPVILWHEGKFHVFSSARFEGPEHIYGKFQLRTAPPYKGKIVALETLPDGSRVISSRFPVDFSITKAVFALAVSALFILILFVFIVRNYKKREERAPTGVAALFEPIYLFVRDKIVYESMGKEHGRRYLPYLATLFFFILFGNLLGIVPIFPFGANTTGNVSVTLVLALLTFLITLGSSTRTYWRHIFNTPGVPLWMKFPIPLMPLVEFIEIFTKPFVLMVRLFANMTAGHIIILGFVCLIFIFGGQNPALGWAVSPLTLLFGLFADALELLVSFIQAYIFTLLSAQYFADALGYEPAAVKKEIPAKNITKK